eukprot:jgi/Galph1/4621/GphlegSOOS_G3226.1
MKSSWKKLLLWSLPVFIVLFLLWQGTITLFVPEINNNTIPNSRMTYGRFLEYLDKGWIHKIDFYDEGHTAIIEAKSVELGDKNQLIRVELPAATPELISKLIQKDIDIDAHPSTDNTIIWNILTNLILPVIFVVGLAFLFRRSGNVPGSPGQAMNFGKSRARFNIETRTGVTFDDIAGIEEAKEEFQEIVTFLKRPERFTAIGARIPKGVLLVGSPGTGKTLLAKAIAGEAGVPFFSISGSEFVEMFVGVGASRVRDLFKKAKENAPCIVFIDEIDAVGRQRGAGIGGGNDEREQTLNQLLTEMDGFEGNTGIIVVAATNRIDVLDVALLRPGRFDRQITVDLPDLNGRIAILKVHSRNKKLSQTVSIETIARRTPGFSGADLANLMNEAAILTARRKKDSIGMAEIDASIDRVIAGMEGRVLTDSKTKRLIAYHEVGHAVVGSLLKNHDPVQKVTLIPRGQAKGLTWFTPTEDQTLISRSQILAKIIAALGGRASEEIVFGNLEITTGASNDLQQVTSIARQMVTRFGMSNIGPLSLENQISDPFLGPSRIDKQVRSILSYCYKEAIEIIKNNRVIIDRIVDILVEKETIEGNELRKLIAKYQTDNYTKTTSISSVGV